MIIRPDQKRQEYEVNGKHLTEDKQIILFNKIKADMELSRHNGNKTFILSCCLTFMKTALEIAYSLYCAIRQYAMILRFVKVLKADQGLRNSRLEIELIVDPSQEQKKEPGYHEPYSLKNTRKIAYRTNYLEDLEVQEPTRLETTLFNKKKKKCQYKVSHLNRSSESEREDSLKKY